jgi:hypothetical protein
MSEYICILITVLYESQKTLLRCAVKIRHADIDYDTIKYWAEPENKTLLHSLLPLHVRSCGPIVEVKEIFEIEMVDFNKGE